MPLAIGRLLVLHAYGPCSPKHTALSPSEDGLMSLPRHRGALEGRETAGAILSNGQWCVCVCVCACVRRCERACVACVHVCIQVCVEALK